MQTTLAEGEDLVATCWNSHRSSCFSRIFIWADRLEPARRILSGSFKSYQFSWILTSCVTQCHSQNRQGVKLNKVNEVVGLCGSIYQRRLCLAVEKMQAWQRRRSIKILCLRKPFADLLKIVDCLRLCISSTNHLRVWGLGHLFPSS